MKLESVSAAGADKFYWMRMNEAGKTVTAEDGSKVKIAPKALFGVREVRGKQYDEILLTTGIRFNLSIKKSESLMDAGKEFKGKVPEIQKVSTVTAPKGNVEKKVKLGKVIKSKPAVVKAIPLTKKEVLVKPTKTKITPVATIDKRKTTETKIDPQSNKLKLSDVSFPELEDFADTDVSEFRRYHVIESTGVKVEKLKISFAEPDKLPKA